MAGEMDQTMIKVCAAAGSLGVLSAIMGFSAEGTKLTVSSDIKWTGRGLDVCRYPQNPALPLGVCAAVFLAMAQVTVTAAGGCCGSCSGKLSRPKTKRTEGVLCAVFSWIAAVLAFGTLVFGAAWNTSQPRHLLASFPVPACDVLLDGVFAGAAALTLAATVLGLASYVLLRGKPATAAPDTGEQQAASAPPPNYPYAPPYHQFLPQGYGAHEPNAHFPQGYGAHAPNQHVPPQGYGAHVPNPQFPPQGYGAHVPNTHFPPQGYGAHMPNQRFPPQGYGTHAPNQQFPPQGYGTHMPNPQFPPQGHWAQQFPPQGFGVHVPNQHFHPQGYGAHVPNQLQFPSSAAQGYEPHPQVPSPPNGQQQV